MDKKILGELNIFISSMFFAISAVFVKKVAFAFDGIFISFFRFLIGAVICVGILFFYHKSFKIRDKKSLFLRAITGSIAMVFYFIAIEMTNGGRATLLNNTFPVFSALLGFLFFKEKIALNSLVSLALCIIGLFLVFVDKSGTSFWGNAVGLLSAVLAALSVHYMKRSRESNNTSNVYLSVCLIGMVITIFSAPKAVVNINFTSLLLLLMVGLTSFVAQFLLSYGIKHTTTTRASIITFFKIPSAMVLGALFLDEKFESRFIIGTSLIIIGLIINSIKIIVKEKEIAG